MDSDNPTGGSPFDVQKLSLLANELFKEEQLRPETGLPSSRKDEAPGTPQKVSSLSSIPLERETHSLGKTRTVSEDPISSVPKVALSSSEFDQGTSSQFGFLDPAKLSEGFALAPSRSKEATRGLPFDPIVKPVELPFEQELRALFASDQMQGAPGSLQPPKHEMLETPRISSIPAMDMAGSTPTFQFLNEAGIGIPSTSVVRSAATPAPFAQAIDGLKLKNDFPLLSQPMNGHRLVWLDNAATTQKPQAVIDRVQYFYEHENSNVHRGAHALAAKATDAYESARGKVKEFLNARSANEIVFVRGATEAINLVAQSWGRRNLRSGDEIVISWLEHHANIVPWRQIADETGAIIRVIPVDDSGQIQIDEYAKLLSQRTKLVSFTQVSNALGTVTPAKQMIEMARAYGAKTLLDGAQAVSHMKVDLQDLNPDWYVLSGHKVFAPTGIGVLYGREDLLNEMPPWQGGGNMIKDVTFERIQYQPSPSRFEAGTGSIAGAVGLGAAIDYLNKIGMDAIHAYEHQLLGYATQALQRIRGLRIIGTAADKAGVVSFVLDGMKTEDVGAALGKRGIAVRSGHHCAQPILRRFGVESTVRPSLALYNTCEDIDRLVEELERMRRG